MGSMDKVSLGLSGAHDSWQDEKSQPFLKKGAAAAGLGLTSQYQFRGKARRLFQQGLPSIVIFLTDVNNILRLLIAAMWRLIGTR